ncbi:MAG: chromate transporter [Acetobacteraceae bacterium]|nr:chromate transporter [Acetobacteraceae bacterium]
MADAGPPAAPSRASLPAILGVFTALGMASFGGGLPGWMHREVVQKRGWITEESFLAGVALGQVLPGANSVNLALYIGQQLRGWPGATMAALGILGPPFLVIIGLALLYARYGQVPGMAVLLGGIAAAGLANSLTVGLRAGRRMRGVWPWVLAGLVFLAVGVARLPMIPVVLVAIPLAILCAWRTRREG